MADDWDLSAVVRSCSSSSTSSSSASVVSTISSVDNFLAFPDPTTVMSLERRDEDLRDFFKPFFPKLKPLVPISPLSILGELPPEKTAAAEALLPVQPQAKRHSVLSVGGAVAPSPRSKRRKIQMKRVCGVAAEDLSSDTWSWRKYGQKPIKGSPYPRSYYKCSTSKGCLARKQVERNRSDPGMFIVTYTSDHNHPMPAHRNSLSGVTRLKPNSATTTATATATEKIEEKEELLEVDETEEDEFGGSDMAVGDDFFEGLEEFGNFITDHFPVNEEADGAGGGG